MLRKVPRGSESHGCTLPVPDLYFSGMWEVIMTDHGVCCIQRPHFAQVSSTLVGCCTYYNSLEKWGTVTFLTRTGDCNLCHSPRKGVQLHEWTSTARIPQTHHGLPVAILDYFGDHNGVPLYLSPRLPDHRLSKMMIYPSSAIKLDDAKCCRRSETRKIPIALVSLQTALVIRR